MSITCREVVEIVTDYLEGALDAETRERLELHLQECDACTEYIAQVRTTVRLAARAEAELELRPDRDALLAAFREFRRSA